VALEKGIIDEGNGHFQPDKAATRMDATTILVRSLGKPMNRQATEAQLKFTDVRTISTDAQNYIAMAVLNNLIKGYEDGSFRPTGSVTRAELATIFARAQESNELGINKAKINGTLTAVSASEFKISVKSGISNAVYNITKSVYGVSDTVYSVSKEYIVISGAAIYRNDQAVELVSLQPQDKVQLLLNQAGEVVFIDAKAWAKAEEQNLLKGYVTQVDANNKTLIVLLAGVLEVRYAVAGDAVIMREGKIAALGDIQVHDRVEMVQKPQGLIVKINVVPAVTKKPGAVISIVKKIKFELKDKDAKIKLEHKEENSKLNYKVELIKLG
jgi:hypothetical protein